MNRFILTVFSVACLTFGWSYLLYSTPKPFAADWIDGLYKRKEAAAASIVGPKAILIGGSSTHFSYQAEVVSRLTGMSVVNLGTHAALGAEYLLDRARRSLAPGDIAIVALEYSLLQRYHPNSIFVSHVVTSDQGHIFRASLGHLPQLLFGYSPLDVWKGVIASTVPWYSPLYRADSVSAFGDETANSHELVTAAMRAALEATDVLEPVVSIKHQIPPPIASFATWASQNDIKLVMAWPVTLDRKEYHAAEYREFFENVVSVYHHSGFSTIKDPAPYMLDADYMLDTAYHANLWGAEKASIALANDLCALNLCPSSSGDEAFISNIAP